MPKAKSGAKSKSPDVSLRERVKEPPAPELVAAYYAPSLEKAKRYCFEPEMRIHLAHGLMLARQDIVRNKDVRVILKALLKLRDAGPDALDLDYTQEDLYSYVERHIVGAVGAETGGRLHTGRSRNDLNCTTWRMALRTAMLEVLNQLNTLRGTALGIARRHAETVMPGYTHTQHAQPITLGYYFLSLADLLGRDFGRLLAAVKQTDRSPLGAGALTTTSFPIDRRYTARMLGFGGVVEIAYDAVSSRDDVHETASALSILMTNLSRLAVDLQNWNMMEYGFVELSGAYCAVSSIMPQKKNPQALEHTKAEAARVIGDLVSTLGSSKNTSLADVNDGVTAINQQALDAAERAASTLALLDGVLRTMAVKPKTMLKGAEIGFGTATELADAIVRESGLSFRIAHNIVGALVRETLAAGKVASDITTEDMDRASVQVTGKPLKLDAQVVRDALDPQFNVRIRTVLGGPAPKLVEKAVGERRKALAEDRYVVRRIQRRIEKADEALLRDAADFARGRKKTA